MRRPRGPPTEARGRVPQWARGVEGGTNATRSCGWLTARATACRRRRRSAGSGERVEGGGRARRKREQRDECGTSREVTTRGEERFTRTAERARGSTSRVGTDSCPPHAHARAGVVSSGGRQRTSLPGGTDGTSVCTRERTDLWGRARATQVPGQTQRPCRWSGVRGNPVEGRLCLFPQHPGVEGGTKARDGWASRCAHAVGYGRREGEGERGHASISWKSTRGPCLQATAVVVPAVGCTARSGRGVGVNVKERREIGDQACNSSTPCAQRWWRSATFREHTTVRRVSLGARPVH